MAQRPCCVMIPTGDIKLSWAGSHRVRYQHRQTTDEKSMRNITVIAKMEGRDRLTMRCLAIITYIHFIQSCTRRCFNLKTTEPRSGSSHLARAKHLFEGGLLSGADGELVGALDLNPGGGVLAVNARQRRLPLVGALVALLRVGASSDCPQLGTLDIIGESLTVGGGPLGSTRLGW